MFSKAKRLLLAIFAIACAGPALAAFAIFQVNGPSSGSSPTTFSHVDMGGMGLVTGNSSVPSANLVIHRTDQYGCYLSVSGSTWKQLLTTTAMSAGSVTSGADGAPHTPSGNAAGCDEAIADPSNPQILWLLYNANLYKSTNQGTSFAATGYPVQSGVLDNGTANNGAIKSMCCRLAVDPNNSSVVYASTFSGGPQRTIDGGTTFAAVSGITTATMTGGLSGGYLFVFDTSAGTTTVSSQTRTKNVYLSSFGTGVYKSIDGGQTWTLTTSTPTTHIVMRTDGFGNLYFLDSSGGGNGLGTARKFNGTTWSNPSFTGNTVVLAVDVDTTNCASAVTCKVTYAIGGGVGTLATTGDGGTSWIGVTTSFTVVSTDVPWIANSLNPFGLYLSGGVYDGTGKFYSGAEGIFTTTPSTSSTGVQTWTSVTAGVEEFLTNTLTTSPNTSGSLLAAGWDVGVFRLTAPYSSYPGASQRGLANNAPIELVHGYGIDWASAAPSTIVALADNQQAYLAGTYHNYSSKSSDGGVTWSALTAPTGISSGGFVGGCIAASDASTYLWMGTDGGGGATAPYYTTNGGTGWTQITVTGTTVTGGWGFQYYLSNHVCTADRVATNTFFIYNWNTGTGGDAIIKCVIAALPCTILDRPGLGSGLQFNPTLKSVPGQNGYLFLSYGLVAPSSADTTGNGFYYYAGNSTKVTIAGAQGVTAFGFGAAFPGHTFPTIVFVGWYNHVYGIWRSIDWDSAKTWQQIGTYPLGRPLSILDVDGDKVTPGAFYYGSQSGVFCGAISPAQCNGTTQ